MRPLLVGLLTLSWLAVGVAATRKLVRPGYERALLILTLTWFYLGLGMNTGLLEPGKLVTVARVVPIPMTLLSLTFLWLERRKRIRRENRRVDYNGAAR